MSRVFCVVILFSLCTVFICAAKEDKWRCGNDFAETCQRAATLDVDNKEKPNKSEAFKAISQATNQVDKLTVPYFEFQQYCQNAETYYGKSDDAQRFIKGFIKTTEKYLEEFTALDIQEDLEDLKEKSAKATSAHEVSSTSKDAVCDFTEEFSNQRSDLIKARDELEKARADLSETPSDEKIEEIKQKGKGVVNEATGLLKKFEEMKRTMNQKFSSADAAGSAAEELHEDAKIVFRRVESAYNKCYKEWRSKIKNGDARTPEDKNHEEQMRLQTCQIKKEENSENSKKDDDKKSNETDASTIEPMPDTESQTFSSEMSEKKNENDDDSKKSKKNENDDDDSKKSKKNDGAAFHALMMNAFVAFLFVASFFC